MDLKTGTLKAKELKKLVVGTAVQEKSIPFATDAKLHYRMHEKLVHKWGS